MKGILLSVLISSTILAAGCEFLSAPAPVVRDVPLQGTRWKLVAFEPSGSLPLPVPPNERYVITFVSDTMFSGVTTVNSYGGSYESDGKTKQLTISYIISTRAYGGPNETRYYAVLGNSVRFSASTDGTAKRLRIFHGNGIDALSFAEE